MKKYTSGNTISDGTKWPDVNDSGVTTTGAGVFSNNTTDANINTTSPYQFYSSGTVAPVTGTPYVVYVKNSLPVVAGYSTLDLNTTNVLPIKLSSFTVKAVLNSAKITWETNSETNNDKFVVERSSDAKSYSPIATVKAKGPLTYYVTDNNPANGTSYYRLVQYDLDGKSETFAPKAVNFNLSNNQSLLVYPNPTNKNISFKLEGFSGTTQVVLLNLQGQTIHQETITNTGSGSYSLSLQQKPAAGQYILQVSNNGIKKSSTVIVL